MVMAVGFDVSVQLTVSFPITSRSINSGYRFNTTASDLNLSYADNGPKYAPWGDGPALRFINVDHNWSSIPIGKEK
jgi:hypothetical protein